MKRSEYLPRPQAGVRVEADGGKSALVFVRELRRAPAQVWSVLTDPAQLREWAPFDAVGELSRTGSTTLIMAGGNGELKLPADVRRADTPRVLEYTWGDDLLTWTLDATSTGTRLTLRHRVQDRSWIPKVCAGWHICLDVAEQFLAGAPIGRIVGEEARNFGWDALNDAYTKQLGLENTGSPSESERTASAARTHSR